MFSVSVKLLYFLIKEIWGSESLRQKNIEDYV